MTGHTCSFSAERRLDCRLQCSTEKQNDIAHISTGWYKALVVNRGLGVQDDYGGDVQASNAELLALQIKRYKLEKWVKEPFFDKTIIGCLVKVSYSGKYHVAEIVEVTEREAGRHRCIM